MDNSSTGKKPRRKVLYWLAGAFSVVIFWKLRPAAKEEKKTVKMLTEDGQLVEVDLKHITGKPRKLKLPEIQNWVKRKG